MRYRAVIEYDGTGYFGFQRQRDVLPTIQSKLEEALARLADRHIGVTGAGRTDRGVHATGQVVSFDVDWKHGERALQRAVNANLPDDIVVRHLQAVSATFHPRFDAQKRAYEYHIYNDVVRSPLYRLNSWHVTSALDLAKMNQAAAALVGRHDFATFGKPPQGENCVREVYTAHWQRRNGLLIFTIVANAFLYRMVRGLVGSLKAVGDGSWSVEQFLLALQARDRGLVARLAPAHGLYLAGIDYGD
jgi:tRNA pseudouridine38-40 synthase